MKKTGLHIQRESRGYRVIKKIPVIISAFVISFMLHYLPAAHSSEDMLPKGDEIVKNVLARAEGETLVRTLKMELINDRGQKRERETRLFRKDFGSERRSVLFFLEPSNIRGTAFLTWDYSSPDKEDDQWIYLPAARKVRRISAANRGDYFMGTDFTYDDIKVEGKPSITEYSHRTLGTEMVDGHLCFKLESIPSDRKIAKELGYGRVVQWIDPENWMARKFAMWDITGNELKTIYFKDITRIDGIWTALRMEAVNHKTGHRSIFSFSDITYGQPIDDTIFMRESLKRGIR